MKRRIPEKKLSLKERNGPKKKNVNILARGTILQVREDLGDRSCMETILAYTQGLWPLTSGVVSEQLQSTNRCDFLSDLPESAVISVLKKEAKT